VSSTDAHVIAQSSDSLLTRRGRLAPETRVVPRARRARLILLVCAAGLCTAFFAFPLLWMVASSFKSSSDIFRYSTPLSLWTFIPPEHTLISYQTVFGDSYDFQWNMVNSLIAAVGQVIGSTVVCSLAAFVFARIQFRGRDQLFALVLLTAFIPLEVTIVPLYVVMRALNLTTSHVVLFLPFIFSPFGVFLLRQAFLDIPRDFDEALIDGASWFRIYRHITMPLAVPALVTQALIQFIWSWNNFLWPLVVMDDPNKKVAQVAIAAFSEAGSNRPLWGEAFASSVAATLPVLIIFFFLQRYYVRGVVMSGLKG
jgi:ABC-type glycerol-3-phosphate transport system permease component